MTQSATTRESALILACARAYCSPEHDPLTTKADVSGVDWALLMDMARRHSLLPIVAAQLTAEPINDHLPEEVRTHLKKALYAAICYDVQFRKWMGEVLDQLAAWGLRPMVLKGPALADRLYPETHLRLSCDLDLMVRPRDLVRAGIALTEAGYQLKHHLPASVDDLAGLDLSPLRSDGVSVAKPRYSKRHDYHLSYQCIVDGRPRLVELHWKPAPARSAVLPADELWKCAATAELSGRKAYTLAPEHQMTLTVFHMINHGWRDGFLRSLLDLSIMASSAPEMDWDWITGLCAGQVARGHAYHVFDWAHRYMGAAIPDEVLNTLRPSAYERWSGRPFRRFEDILESSDHESTLRDLADGLSECSSSAEAAAFLAGVVMPPAHGLAQMRGLPSGSALYAGYLLRPLHILLRAVRRTPIEPRPVERPEEDQKPQLTDRSRMFRAVEKINTWGSRVRSRPGWTSVIGRGINFASARAFDLYTLCIVDARRWLCPIDLARIAQGHTDDMISDQEKADALCRYVYDAISYARSVTWLEPADVVRLGYGDCKCQARLLQELMADAGLEGKVVVGITGRRAGISRIHAWVEARLDGQTMVCDPTMSPRALDPGIYDQRTGGILDVTPEYALKRTGKHHSRLA